MTTIEKPDATHQPLANRVTVVDFDMPFGSMIVFMLKWALAAVPALLILIMIGVVASVAFAGLIAALTSTSSLFPQRAERDNVAADSSTPALVVTMRHTTNGWQVVNDTSVEWQKCALSIEGHSVTIPMLSSNSALEVKASQFSGGGLPADLSVTQRTVSMFCVLPRSQTARIYLLQ